MNLKECTTNKQIVETKSMSVEDMAEFIRGEISFDKMIKNSGIYETSPVAIMREDDCSVTIGVTYEDNPDFVKEAKECASKNQKEHYYYNIFIGQEYVDIDNSTAYKENPIPALTVKSLIHEIDELVAKGDAIWVLNESKK